MKAIQAPKDIEYVPIYEPDMERMVKALKIVLAIPIKKEETNNGSDDSRICGQER